MDSLIFFIVECVAIPIHWMVEKCEVPMEEEDGSEGAVLGPPPHHLCFGAEVRMGSANRTNSLL